MSCARRLASDQTFHRFSSRVRAPTLGPLSCSVNDIDVLTFGSMSLRVESRFPGGNVAAVRINTKNDPPEVVFASDPAGGPECLWFNFRLVETEPDGALPQKVTLTLRFFRNMLGAERPDALRPVLRSEGQNWMRVRAGILHVAPDGQKSLSWSIPYPTPSIDVALEEGRDRIEPGGAAPHSAEQRLRDKWWRPARAIYDRPTTRWRDPRGVDPGRYARAFLAQPE
jgi:hypothetical protein